MNRLSLSILVLSFLAPALSGARAEVPETIAAPGEILLTTVHATGAQVYECQFDLAGNLIWHFREPIATLVADGKTVGRHFAGPIWEMDDGSAVSAKVSGRAPGASSNDIALLRLAATRIAGGKIAGVTTIQRLNTKGGVAEGACDSHGKLLSVPYSADYAFYTKNKGF
jgi:uncharacterized protein DUF3455